MSNNRKVSSETLKVQKDNGQFNDPRFQLRAGFAGVHEVLDVSDALTKDNEVYSHMVSTKSMNGVNSITGSVMARAILVKDASQLEKISTVKDGVKDIWYKEDIMHLAHKPLHHAYRKDTDNEYEDFEYPESLEILGAFVYPSKGGEGHPQVSLNKYLMFGIMNRHHRDIHDKFLTWADAQFYVNSTGKDRPAGLPDDFKLELPSKEAAWESHNWTFSLIIKDFDA